MASIMCRILVILATINSSVAPKSSSSATELEAVEDRLLLETDDASSLVSAWMASDANCEEGMPSRIGSMVASLNGKISICISDTVFEMSPISQLALGLNVVSLDATVSRTCELFEPAKSDYFCRAS